MDWVDKFGYVEFADALRSVDDENEDAGSYE